MAFPPNQVPNRRHPLPATVTAGAVVAPPCEIWLPINGYDGAYSVSDNGRVRNDISGRILVPFVTSSGYAIHKLFKRNVGRNFKTHRLVASAFIPNVDGLPQVNHRDLNKLNNAVSNLEWCTAAQNSDHFLDRDVRDPLLRFNGRRLTYAEATSIRRLAAAGVSQSQIAKEVGIDKTNVRSIIHWRTYKRPSPRDPEFRKIEGLTPIVGSA